MARKKGLGKGLDALIGAAVAPSLGAEAESAPGGQRILHLDPHAIQPNPKQPRKAFGEDALQELAESIKRDGVQEPVIVRKAGEAYELVTGERRVRACIMADCATVPAICREVSDEDMLRLGLIENIHREDLNAIELARGYEALIEELGWTQEQLADEIGKKRATVTNTLRLLNLPGDIQRHVVEGQLTMGHARALLALDSPEAQYAAARKIVDQGLSVRQAEKLVSPKAPKPKREPKPKDPNVLEIEDELRRRLGTKVAIRSTKNQRGRIEIEYFNLDDLGRILAVLRGAR